MNYVKTQKATLRRCLPKPASKVLKLTGDSCLTPRMKCEVYTLAECIVIAKHLKGSGDGNSDVRKTMQLYEEYVSTLLTMIDNRKAHVFHCSECRNTCIGLLYKLRSSNHNFAYDAERNITYIPQKVTVSGFVIEDPPVLSIEIHELATTEKVTVSGFVIEDPPVLSIEIPTDNNVTPDALDSDSISEVSNSHRDESVTWLYLVASAIYSHSVRDGVGTTIRYTNSHHHRLLYLILNERKRRNCTTTPDGYESSYGWGPPIVSCS